MPSVDAPLAKRQKVSLDQNVESKSKASGSKIFYPFRVGSLASILSPGLRRSLGMLTFADTGISIANRSSIYVRAFGKSDIPDHDLCGEFFADIRFTARTESGVCQSTSNTRDDHSGPFVERQDLCGLGQFPAWIAWRSMGFQARKESRILGGTDKYCWSH